MRYIGTTKVVCPACGVELDVPLYHTNEVKITVRAGMIVMMQL